MKDITHAENTQTEEDQSNLSGPESILFSQPQTEMFSLSGENSKTIPVKKGSTAPYSEMNRKSCHQTLSEKLTPLLLSRGLVKGTTLTFGLRLSHRGIPAGVLYAPDGSVVDILKMDL